MLQIFGLMMNKPKFEYAEYEGNYFRWEVDNVVMDILRGDKWEPYTGSSPVQTFGVPVDEDEIYSAIRPTAPTG